MRKFLLLPIVLSACLPLCSIVGQTDPVEPAVEPSPKTGTEGEQVEGKPKGPPPLAMTTTKVYSEGEHYTTLAKVNTGKEFIGLSVPAKYWFKTAENGRQITVYMDSSRRSGVDFRFHTNSFPDFTHELVWPMVSGYFDGLQPVFSKGSGLGQAALVFTATGGKTDSRKQIRCLVMPCDAGSISVTAVAYDDDADRVFSVMKQLASSLQRAPSEQGLVRSVPTAFD